MKSERAIVLLPSAALRAAFWVLLVVGTAVSAVAQTSDEPVVRVGVVGVYAFATVACVAASAFCSGSETAFLSANRALIASQAEKGDHLARALTELYAQPERTQAAILVGNNLVNVGAAAFSLMFIESVTTGLEPQWRDLANTAIVTPLLIIFGEVLPKSVARAHPDRFLSRGSRVLAALEWALRPVGVVILLFATALMRLTGHSGEAQIVTREDLRTLAELGETQGVIHQEQRRMIHAVLELEGQRVSQVMRPLADIVSVAEGIAAGAFLELTQASGYSRVPVYRDRINNFVGVVHVLDVIYAGASAVAIEPFVRRDLYYVPETKRVTTLLAELRFRRNPMAFVVDEYGGIVGLVTVEDLVEEIVGEIRDERDGESSPLRRDELTATLECDGKMEIDALNHELEAWDTEIERGDYETVAGYIIHALDRIPRANDVVETDDLLCIVLAADDKSVLRVKIVRKRGRSRRR